MEFRWKIVHQIYIYINMCVCVCVHITWNDRNSKCGFRASLLRVFDVVDERTVIFSRANR